MEIDWQGPYDLPVVLRRWILRATKTTLTLDFSRRRVRCLPFLRVFRQDVYHLKLD